MAFQTTVPKPSKAPAWHFANKESPKPIPNPRLETRGFGFGVSRPNFQGLGFVVQSLGFFGCRASLEKPPEALEPQTRKLCMMAIVLPLVSREWKNGSNSSYNCTPFLPSLLTKGKWSAKGRSSASQDASHALKRRKEVRLSSQEGDGDNGCL